MREPTLGGSVRIGRKDTLGEKLGLRILGLVEIEGEVSVFLEYMLYVRELSESSLGRRTAWL
jgi:hypothetical protein